MAHPGMTEAADRAGGERLTSIKVRPVLVPIRRPLKTSTGEVSRAPLVLIDIATSSGVVGRAYLFAIAPWAHQPLTDIVRGLFEMVSGHAVAPLAVNETLRRRLTLPGTHGLAGMALSGIDMAIWDAFARLAGLPLVRLLGGELRPVPAYNSNGLGIIAAEAAATEAVALAEEGGFPAVKIRLGRPDARADIAAVRAVREVLPLSVDLMCDFNQALTVAEAIRRGRMLDDEECMIWIEEPVRADDFAGCAAVADSIATPVQIGENFSSIHQMHDALREGASAFVMPDVQRIGGVTGWMQAAALAATAGIEMSSHLFSEISAHLLAATPTRHWLEYMDWANAILAEPLKIRDGAAVLSDEPGCGVNWDEGAVERYAATF
jgi:mandelate racemase